MGTQLCEKFHRGQVKGNHVSSKRIDPNEVVYSFRSIQKDPGIPNMHMMLGRRLIEEIFFGHADDRGIDFNHIEIEFRPSMGEPLCQRSASMAKDQARFASDTNASDATIN